MLLTFSRDVIGFEGYDQDGAKAAGVLHRKVSDYGGFFILQVILQVNIDISTRNRDIPTHSEILPDLGIR